MEDKMSGSGKVMLLFKGAQSVEELIEVCTEDALRKFLESYGPHEIRPPTGQGPLPHVAIVQLEKPEDAVRALDGLEWNGLTIQASQARPPFARE